MVSTKQVKSGAPSVDKALEELRRQLTDKARSHQYCFGAADIGTTVTGRYLYPGYDNIEATTGAKWQIALHDGQLKNFRISVRDAGDTTDTIQAVVQVNLKDTALAVQFSSRHTGVFESRNNSVVHVKAGDRISVIVRKGTVYVTSPAMLVANLELEY